MIGKIIDQAKEETGQASSSKQSVSALAFLKPALKPGADVKIKMEGGDVKSGTVTLKTNTDIAGATVDANLKTEVAGNNAGKVSLSLKASGQVNQDTAVKILDRMNAGGMISKDQHDKLVKAYKDKVNDLKFSSGAQGFELNFAFSNSKWTTDFKKL